MVVVLLAECSVLLPPGPKDPAEYLGSVAALLAAAVVGGIGSRIHQQSTRVAALLVYLGSWTLLTLAAGGPRQGLLVVVLVPVLWAASFDELWVSVLMVVSMCTAVAVAVSLDSAGVAVDIRLVVFVAFVAVIATTAVRIASSHLLSTIAQRDELLREGGILAAADRELMETRLPADVLAVACRIASEIASPPGSAGRRSTYLRVDNGVVRVAAGYDSQGALPSMGWPLVDHPYLATVVLRHEPMSGPLSPELLGPTLKEYARVSGITHGAWVPVSPNGTLDGVLTVMGRGAPVSDQLLGQLTALGRVVAPALANAYINERVEEEALTDSLTGLFNRRGLLRTLAERATDLPVAVLSIDVDGLKHVNDTQGHAAGDALICAVALAISDSLRDQDIAARVGGDEFVGCLVGATAAAALTVAERIFDHLSAAGATGPRPRVSMGIAMGTPPLGFAVAAPLADTAMYVAKQHGGNRIEEWRPLAVA